MALEEPAPPVPPAAAAAAHGKLMASAEVIKGSSLQMVDSADRRTELASDRTALAAERTYAAWIRTGLAALASGVGARALLTQTVAEWVVLTTGSVLIAFSAFCFIVAVWRDLTTKIVHPEPSTRRVSATALIVVSSVLSLVALAALIGIWQGGHADVVVRPSATIG